MYTGSQKYLLVVSSVTGQDPHQGHQLVDVIGHMGKDGNESTSHDEECMC